ncbi:Chromosomal replication initiator protein DnaA [Paramagnetospirillum magnetotacticum MS-1]|uniref:Chromosomal replication initiator protein DnaA n=1 Tax=Paramagnetospirillum magnetotacticum MS-1 TaxID=272627 RepID=A0A0C2YTI9_PARME|nr:ATPase involved in DNA replication initiation [Paramagnetospirillum magnetotacticum]KIL98468.1 Chromosomal replication initiator protein DnaA [Paramagnetospirillum magnetotacticum MS-1]
MSEAQLPLAFGHVPSLAAEDFLVAPCNAEAHAWVGAPQRWPGPASILCGPAGSGKTHLAHLFARDGGGILVPAAQVTEDSSRPLLESVPVLVVEDCDRASLDEVALFHLINQSRELGRFLLLTARSAPAHWAVRLPDLRSRLLAMPVASILAPDDALLAALLVKLFDDRQLRIGEDVVHFLVGRMERSFAAAASLVDRLDRAAWAGRRAVTVPLARRILEGEDHGSGTEGP